MTVTRARDARRTSTPNAEMTTFASPTQGGSRLALWRTEMTPGAQGPVHTMDGEQVWSVLSGAASVTIGRTDSTGGDAGADADCTGGDAGADADCTGGDAGADADCTGRVRVVDLAEGDTLVLAAGEQRQITADPQRGLVAVVAGPGGATASGPGRDPVVPPWVA